MMYASTLSRLSFAESNLAEKKQSGKKHNNLPKCISAVRLLYLSTNVINIWAEEAGKSKAIKST